MTLVNLPPAAVAVEQVIYANTCTSRTVEDVRCLLGLAGGDIDPQPPNQLKQKVVVGKNAVRNTKVPPVRTKAAKNSKPILASGTGQTECLELSSSTKLATQIVNASLKVLTALVRQTAAPDGREQNSQGIKSADHTFGSLRTSKPLQSLSPNHQSGLKGVSTASALHTRKPSLSTTTRTSPNIIALAECTSAAFTVLRRNEDAKDKTAKMKTYQLELGMSSFIGKLLALDLIEIAITELHELVPRLQDHIGTAKTPAKTTKLSANSREKSLADLLVYRKIPDQQQALDLAITAQLQVLKLLGQNARPTTVQYVLSVLGGKGPTILSAVEKRIQCASSDLKQKAARWLDQIIQVLETLALIKGTPEASKSHHSSGFGCRMLACQLRLRSWSLNSDARSIQKYVLDPFTSYIASFSRQKEPNSEEKYTTMTEAVKLLIENLEVTVPESFTIDEVKHTKSKAYRALADAARECHKYYIAGTWLEKALKDSNDTICVSCTLFCQRAILLIQQMLSGEANIPLHSGLHNAVEQLKQDLQGSSAEIEELFLSVASLRKHAVALLVKASDKSRGSNLEVTLACQNLCREIVQQSVRFLVRFAEGIEPTEDNCDPDVRRERRIGLVINTVSPTVEAISAVARTLSTDDQEPWDQLAHCLRGCQKLILKFGSHQDPIRQSYPTQSQRHPLTTISNAFWCRYLTMKSSSSKNSDMSELLRSSIDPLLNCTLEEREAGFLHLKQEKLAIIMESRQNWEEARAGFQCALETLVSYPTSIGFLQHVDLRSDDITSVRSGNISRLTSLVASYVRVQARPSSQSSQDFIPFCASASNPEVRGILLELQLRVVINALDLSHSLGSVNAVSKLHALLRETYRSGHFVQRRARVHLQLLHGLCISPKVIPANFIGTLDQEVDLLYTRSSTNDQAVKHLRDQHKVYTMILRKHKDMVELESICSSWHDLLASKNKSTQDVQFLSSPEWLAQLKLLQDFLHFAGEERLLAVVTDILIAVGQPCFTLEESIHHSAVLCQQLTRLGHCDLARRSLLQTQRLVEGHQNAQPALMQWYLAYADCLLAIENCEKCQDMLNLAENQAQALWGVNECTEVSVSGRYLQLFWVSQLMHMKSRLSTAKGNHALGVYYSKRSTRLIYRAWSVLDRQRSLHRQDRPASEPGFVASSSTTESVPTVSTEHDSLQQAAFWTLAPVLFRHSATLSKLLVGEGLILEAQYYAERAEKVARAVASNSLIIRAIVLKTYINRLAGDKLTDLPSLEELASGPGNMCPPVHAKLKLALAEAYHVTENLEDEVRCLKDVEGIIQQGLQPPLKLLNSNASTIDALAKGIETLNIDSETSTAGHRKAINSRRTAKTADPAAQHEPVSYNLENRPKAGVAPLMRQQAQRLRQSALLSICLKDFDLASRLLQEAQNIIACPQDSVRFLFCHVTLSTRKAQGQLAKDPVFSLLEESSIMYPSVADPLKSQPSSPLGKTKQITRAKANKKAQSPKSVDLNTHHEHSNKVTELLDSSNQSLFRLFSTSQAPATTVMGHQFSDILFKVQLLLSTTSLSFSNVTLTPTSVAYAFEYGRSLAFMRDDASSIVDRLLGDKESSQEILVHPSLSGIPVPSLEVTNFREEYIDIMPANWTALSIAISADHEELRICRMRAHHAPLTLSIPLRRHNPRDCEDEEPFGFDEGKAELLEIISLANFSAHEGCDLSQKGARTAWWETRAALDARLKDLVHNIQNMWIGGFRGIFSQHVPPPTLLSRFQKSLDHILNQHLPSRRRNTKGSKEHKVGLDVQVLELFLGLGSPADNDDLDEALLDLFYFVVDILQFHGERNAYDEIDFDPMIVATLDVLTQYHNTVAELHGDSISHHTVLILDRALHGFPWESLPCLDGLAVSRLPSLSCLRDRILLQKQQAQSLNAQGSALLTANVSSGAYILNPTGDLTSTHKTFAPLLSSLTSWDATVKSPPTEDSIISALSTRSLYLYFGHGSGGQYVRSRAIRKLEQCAVAMLWGCSSGALTEAGELESYGPVMAYLHAKSPAVVGTLWDVTDKDIDRFAMRALERWGLFEPKMEGKGEKSKSRKGKGKQVPESPTNEAKGRLSLDQALAEARGSCILRYLNGAAPVVYGVPIMLSDNSPD